MTTSANAQVFVNPALPDQWLTQVTTTIGLESLSSGFYLLRIGTERYKFTKL